MTVSELIASLARYPPTARVVVDGFESGLEDVIELTAASIVRMPIWVRIITGAT